ncbi:MAG: glycosyltransferase family 4 protein [Legionellales bacterium]|nr:glycosyltransferase family 4 protein [Legionellales bacterium]
MNILIVTQYFWPESFRINDLAVSLKKLGHTVTVLTSCPNYPEGRIYEGYGWFKKTTEIYEGITIKRVPVIPRGKNNPIKLCLNYLSYVISASLLGLFYCREKIDVIFVYEPSPITVGLPAIFLKKWKKAKLFFWVQDLWPETLEAVGMVRSPSLLKCLDKLSAFIYRHCDKILIQCEGFKESVEKKGVNAEKIYYFPNWAEEVYRPLTRSESKVDQSLFSQGFNIVFAGNLGVAQSLETIVSAAEKLQAYQDIHWFILGDGRQADWLAEQVKEKKLTQHVHLLGRHPMEHMPEYFAMADILLVTLKYDPVFSITIPAKIQSYLACGKPIVGALSGFGADLIKNSGAGFAGEAEDAEQLAKNILLCYNMNKTQLNTMGENGLQYCREHFDRNKLIVSLVNWMQDDI